MQQLEYPFSVVPGGIANDDQFQANHQPHYADIGFLHRSVITEDKWMYSSYKKDGRIYWTAKPVKISRFELLLTDRTRHTTVRGRCGNLLSETPRTPVAFTEPPEAIMNLPPTFTVTEPPALIFTPGSPDVLLPPIDTLYPPLPSWPTPGYPDLSAPGHPEASMPDIPVTVAGGGGSHAGWGELVYASGGPHPIPPRPVVTPEPGAGTLLFIGLALLVVARKMVPRPGVDPGSRR